MLELGQFPVALLMLPLLIPLAYVLKKNREELKAVASIAVCCAGVVIFYPVVSYLSYIVPLFGYSIGKFLLFVLFPLLTVFYIERWSPRDILSNLGARKEGLAKSLLYGLLAAAATIAITLFIIATSQFDPAYRTIMFFEAFTEEFFFRGFLFLYLLKKTTPRIAYITSVLGFILIHPQNFTNLFIISTAAQGILLTIVTDKTRNIIGPWIAHGANRFFPVLIRNLLGI